MNSPPRTGMREWIEIDLPIPSDDGSRIVETIKVKVEGAKDPSSGEIFLDGEALDKIDKAKARHMGLLLPCEIKDLRNQLGLTQSEISKLLGLGEKTYTLWETGRQRPTKVISLLLRSLRDGRLNIAALQAAQRPHACWQPQAKRWSQGFEEKPDKFKLKVDRQPNETLALAA